MWAEAVGKRPEPATHFHHKRKRHCCQRNLERIAGLDIVLLVARSESEGFPIGLSPCRVASEIKELVYAELVGNIDLTGQQLNP